MTTSVHWRDIPVFQIGNRQDISGWQTDPRLALLQRHKVGLVMVPPVGLDEFISSEHFVETATQFIHGAKGSGKTSLLLAKRALLDQPVADRKLLCVPTAFPYVFSPFMDDTTISFETWESLGFAERDAWKYAWLVLLGAYVLNALDRDVAKNTPDKDRPELLLSETLVRMLAPDRGDDQLQETRWIGCFKTLIENVRGNPLETLRRVYEAEILPHLQGVIASRQKPIFVFVDGIDETFRGPGGSPLLKLVKEKKLKRLLKRVEPASGEQNADPYKLARQLWVNAQASLLSVSTELLLQSKACIRLIGSMRSEAYVEATVDGAQAAGQRADLVRAIQYTRDHLEAIVRANIRASLKMPNFDRPSKEDEFVRYFGSAEIKNHQVGIDESIFQYLCRHTFEEPRDLMLIGGKLAAMPEVSRRDASRVSDVVVPATQVMLTDYFHFMDEDWDPKFEQGVFEHIGRNILTMDDAKNVARAVREAGKVRTNHPLCYLFKRGLIGIVDENLTQVFQRIALVNGAERHRLPPSGVYLVHPVLDRLINQAREKAGKDRYVVTQGIAIGNGLPWIPGMRMKRVRVEVSGVRVKLSIDGHSLSETLENRTTPTFHSVSDIPTALLIACLQEMVNLNANEPSIDSVMYNIQDLVDGGRLPRTTQRGGRKVQTTEYIRDFLLEPERVPPPFETINSRLFEHNQNQISISRSLKTQSLTIRGIDWTDIEVAGSP